MKNSNYNNNGFSDQTERDCDCVGIITMSRYSYCRLYHLGVEKDLCASCASNGK